MVGKSGIALWIVVALMTTLVACKSSREVKHSGEIITLTDSLFVANGCDTVRFGHIRSGEVVVKQLLFHNATGRSLAVTSYDASCGCTTLEYAREPFGNDADTPIRVVFDTRGEWGWQMKLMKIYIAPYSTPLKIYIEADVD